MSKVRFVGRMAGASVPRYHLYGESGESSGDWFVNVEPLADRCRASNWRIEPHQHPRFCQIVFVRSGRGTMTVEADQQPFVSPCVLIVPVNIVHGFAYDIDTDGWVLTLAQPYLQQLLKQHPDLRELLTQPRILSLSAQDEETEDIRGALLRIDRELDGRAPGNVIAAEACLLTLLVAILRRSEQSTSLKRSNAAHASIVGDFRELIDRRYREGWPLTRFAVELNVPLSLLRNACLAVEGQPPSAILHDRIIVEAKRNLVYSDMTIAQIAYWLGFQDPAYFTRFFTRICNESPTRYREHKRAS
jgi:AraC family transcriptional activator of pobA